MRRATALPRSRDRLARSEPLELFKRPGRSLPARVAGLVMRLRAELTTAAVALTVWLWLVARMAVEVAGLLVGLVLLAVATWPASHRYVVRRAYAVMTRHRLRATFVERRIMNYSGNVPVLLWARPIPTGERVWLLLRAGIDAHDIERNLSYIGSACWGGDARVKPWGSMAAFVTVDVIRRDPLAAPIASPLGGPRRLNLVDSAPALPAGGVRGA